jgi:hypothetical protein
VAAREQALVFGEVAGEYDDVRAGYPPELVETVLSYTGTVDALVDVAAGTGKATAAFLGTGLPITCVEPDPAMASVLRQRFAGPIGAGQVRVRLSRFEDWVPPAGGVRLLCCAQAWHWVDPGRRWELAHAALSEGGTLALFGHEYAFVDTVLEEALRDRYAVLAPELLDDPASRPTRPEDQPMYREMVASGRFVDLMATEFDWVLSYPTARYLTLLGTFSNHRMLPVERRTALQDGLAGVIDAHGGVVETQLKTGLALGRRA